MRPILRPQSRFEALRSTRAVLACSVALALAVTLTGLYAIPFAPKLEAPNSSGGSAPVLFADARAALSAAGPLAEPALVAGAASPGGYLWSNLSGSLPISPSGRITAMAWDPTDGYVLLFGGEPRVGPLLTDTWSFANGSWTNLTPEVTGAPPALDNGELAFDSTSGAMILWGPLAANSLYTVTWAYHAKAWTNLTGSAGTEPPARITEAFTPDSTDGGILLFSGRPTLPIGPLLDTWSFKSGHWTNLTATAGWTFGTVGTPTGADDPPDHGVLVYGYNLLNSTTAASATYLFSGGVWRNLTTTLPSEPAPSVWAKAGYLSSLHSVVLYEVDFANKLGGVEGFSSTYLYSNGVWANLTLQVAGPPAVGFFMATTVIGSDSALLAFGGALASGPFAGYTWVLSGQPGATANSYRSVLDAGMAVTLTGSAAGGVSPYSYHWSLGDGTNSSSASTGHTYGSSGLHTATLTLTDFAGRSASTAVTVEVNPTLSPSIVLAPSPATAGVPVGFVASVSGGTAPFSFHWSFGDSTTSTAASGTHTYPAAGNYTVTLNVTDSLGGTTTSTATLSVANAAASPPSTGSGSSSISLTSGTGLDLLLGIIVLGAVAGALGALLSRRSRSPPGPVAPYASAAPAAAGVPASYGPSSPPPPGASGPNPPRSP